MTRRSAECLAWFSTMEGCVPEDRVESGLVNGGRGHTHSALGAVGPTAFQRPPHGYKVSPIAPKGAPCEVYHAGNLTPELKV